MSFEDVKHHRMRVLHDDGLYRDLAFGRTGDIHQSFRLTTWPGYLCISGDMGCYVFSRTDDMFNFFRGDRINLKYWSEKVVAESDCMVREFDPSALAEYLDEETLDWPAAIREAALRAIRRDNEQDAFRDLCGFRSGVYRFCDISDVDFSKFTFHFTWCCQAIVWAIKQYDAHKVGE